MKATELYNSLVPSLKRLGFRKTTSTSMRKDYGIDGRGDKYYIRLSPKLFTVNGLGPLPNEMVHDLKDLRFWLGM